MTVHQTATISAKIRAYMYQSCDSYLGIYIYLHWTSWGGGGLSSKLGNVIWGGGAKFKARQLNIYSMTVF